MSHTTVREPRNMNEVIDNLPALEAAAARCGGRFLRDKHSFRSWGNSDVKQANNKPCVHAIAPAGSSRNYEVGVLDDGNGQYTLACDFWDTSIGQTFGQNLDNLIMFYQMETTRNKAALNGDLYSDQKLDDGSYEVRIDTTARLGY